MAFGTLFYLTFLVSVFCSSNAVSRDQTLTATEGEQYLTSPGYPLAYPNNFHYRWEIVGPFFSRIKVTVLNSDMDQQDGCAEDIVEVLDGGATDWNAASLGSFCFTTPSFTSSGHLITVRFITDGSGTSKGFQLKYYYVGSTVRWSPILILMIVVVVVSLIVLCATVTIYLMKNSERRIPLGNQHQNQPTEQRSEHGSPHSNNSELSAPPPTYNAVINSDNINNNNNSNKDNLDDTSPPPYSSLCISDTTVDM